MVKTPINDEKENPKIIKLRLSITKKEAHQMTRVRRWEQRSEKVSLTLGPSKYWDAPQKKPKG